LHPWTGVILWPIYYAMGAAIVAALVATRRRGELLRALGLAAVLGLLCYWIFPAVGPRWIASSAQAFPNGFPSLHFAIAILCWWYSARFRAAFLGFAILTACATLGLGEHYAVDLAAAIALCGLVVLAVAAIERVAAARPSSAVLLVMACDSFSLGERAA
jgi:hypothetical protein